MLQATFRGMKNMETTKNVANFNSTQLSENEPWIAEVTMKEGIQFYSADDLILFNYHFNGRFET
jgi:hypothetical protein